jgi:hypothetical protein
MGTMIRIEVNFRDGKGLEPENVEAVLGQLRVRTRTRGAT